MAINRFLTIAEAAQFSGLRQSLIRKRIETGDVPQTLLGEAAYVQASHIVELSLTLAARRCKSTPSDKSRAPIGLIPALPAGTKRGDIRFMPCPIHKVDNSLFILRNEVRCHFGCTTHHIAEHLRRESMAAMIAEHKQRPKHQHKRKRR